MDAENTKQLGTNGTRHLTARPWWGLDSLQERVAALRASMEPEIARLRADLDPPLRHVIGNSEPQTRAHESKRHGYHWTRKTKKS